MCIFRMSSGSKKRMTLKRKLTALQQILCVSITVAATVTVVYAGSSANGTSVISHKTSRRTSRDAFAYVNSMYALKTLVWQLHPFSLNTTYFFLPEGDTVVPKRTKSIIPTPVIERDKNTSKFDAPRYGLPSGLDILRTIDSTGEYIKTQERIDGVDVGIPNSIKLDDYLLLRQQQISRSMWDSLMTKYDLKAAMSGDQLSKLISQATNIAIPLPPNPLTSIFGKPEISINVNGEVTVRGGWRWDSQNLGASSAFGQSQSAPVFTQDIQINVSGRIGDKLKLGTDWSTRRQFEFDNRFKIGYDGYDDDIIKRIELGNVQLQTPSSFIRGSQALFGVRADFQFGPLFLKTIASQKRGEQKIITVNGGSSRTRFVLRGYDYAQNHFFLDTAYKSLYREYWKYSTPQIPTTAPQLRVKEIVVYESSGDVRDQAVGGVEVIAYDTLSPIQYANNERYPNSMKVGQSLSGRIERGRFIKLDETSGRFTYDKNLGKLDIINMRRDRTYAVAYRTEGATNAKEDDLYTGSLVNSKDKDTLILKLIYRPNMQPAYTNLWARQMRNIYFINATNVNTQDAKINIYYLRTNNDSTDVLEGTPDKIVTGLRVDQVNNATGQQPGDGVFDFSGSGSTAGSQGTSTTSQQSVGYSGSPFFDAQRGEIIFPSLEPFREGLDTAFGRRGIPATAKQFYYSSIYDNQVELAKQQTAQDRWIIVGDVQGQSAGRIPLGYNIATGSVKVRLDGRELRENDDFTVEYISGMLTLRNPQAQVPGANLSIEYESNDIMNVTTKTLAGIRADVNVYKTRNFNSSIGATYMYYNQAMLLDRVRIGEEPVSNAMAGVDGQMQWTAKWLTDVLDALPFYETKEKSTINLRGEWALQMPTPNKRISDVPTDNGQAVAYIDDFESAQRSISLGLSATQWTHAAVPVDSTISPDDSIRGTYRGKNSWWQYFIGRIPSTDPYPNRQTIQGRSNISGFYIDFNPDLRGLYNHNINFLDSLSPKWDSVKVDPWAKRPENREKIWGGFQRLLSSFNSNFDLENIDYIEIMMQVDPATEPTAKMYIDLGQISEDIIPNHTLNTEDGITSANPVPNGRIDPGEDLGIDAQANDNEKIAYQYPLNLESDPARDDYSFDFQKDASAQSDLDFDKYNNYEGNSTQSELGQFPDTEILNKQNGQTIALDDSYFSYEVNLDPSAGNPQVVGGGNNNWRLYRIPLRGAKKTIGNPLFSNIQYVRVWFKGGRLKATIVDWRFAGAQWQRINYAAVANSAEVTDNTLRVSFVNREEHYGPPDYYTMPPGVQAPRNLANSDYNSDIRLNEQSLVVGVDNLNCGEERAATRFFRTFDMFYYKSLKFFVKGIGGQDFIPPDSLSLTPADTTLPQFYVRFGTDSANYYEYRAPIVREWKNVAIDLEKLTAIKQRRDSLGQFTRMVFGVENEPLARYAILGNPVLTRVQYVSFGIANPRERCPKGLSTTVWIDELRLLDPLSDNDWAGTGALDIKLADLGNFRMAYTQLNPNFHRLEERFGNRETTREFSATFDAGFEKFLPKSWKDTRIPFSFSRITRERDPQFQAQNDVNIEAAAAVAYNQALANGESETQATDRADYVRRRSRTRWAQTSFGITGFKFGLPSNEWYIRETINRLALAFTYFQEAEQSPVVQERFLWRWDFSAQYSVNIPAIASVRLGGIFGSIPLIKEYKDWKINFLPQTLSLSTKFTRSRRTEQSWFLQFPTPPERHFDATNSMSLQWKLAEGGLLSPTLDYNMVQGSTLVPLELDSLGNQLTGSDVMRKVLFTNNKFIDFGTPNNLSQNVVINFRPKLPDFGGINKYFDANGSFTTNYSWFDPMQRDPALSDVAKQVRTTNNIRITSNLRLRQMTNAWFGITPPSTSAKPDTTKSSSLFADIADLFRSLIFDYESFNINFTQGNTANTPGVFGGTGFSNFWGRGATFRASENFLGPSAAYQLGLVRYPHGSYRITSSSKFPFFGFEEDYGLRPPNAQLQDNFTQRTNLEMRTSRPLWKNATLDLNWRTEFSNNRNQLTTTDAQGNMTFTNVILTEQYNRTFLTMPDFFLLSVFNNTPENVINRYRTAKKDIIGNKNEDSLSIDDQIKVQNAMTDAFIGGLQAFEAFPGALLRFLPALNWSFRWEGIEKYWFFGGIAQRVSLEHNYQSSYTENARVNDNGRTVDAQTVQMAFQPLVGVTFTFDEKQVKGNLTGNLRYNTRTNYALAAAARTLSRDIQKEFSLNATYTIRGFQFAVLGIDLKNDVEFSFLSTYRRTSRSTYTLSEVQQSQQQGTNGSELDGQTSITIEPRARYTVSNRVTASAFFRYDGNFSTGASNPGYSTTQVGLEVRLAISGGR
ncbi:MAG: cell surface protein SprA [Candidatus Kapaibacterium sp.]